MRKTDPDFPGKLLHTWPLLSGLILLLGVQVSHHLWTMITISDAEMLMPKRKS